MFFILSWLIYGIIVGVSSKLLHPGNDPIGFLPTIAIGVAGSYIGGLINFILGYGCSSFSPSGILMGIIGGVIFCWAYRNYRLNKIFEIDDTKSE